MICSFNFLTVCLNTSTVINIKILTISNQQTQSYKFTSHIAAFLSVVLITEMLEICIQTSYDQNVQLIIKSCLPVVYGTPPPLISNNGLLDVFADCRLGGKLFSINISHFTIAIKTSVLTVIPWYIFFIFHLQDLMWTSSRHANIFVLLAIYVTAYLKLSNSHLSN